MMDAFFELPLLLHGLLGWIGTVFLVAPIIMLRLLERIHAQNELIISMLVDPERGNQRA